MSSNPNTISNAPYYINNVEQPVVQDSFYFLPAEIDSTRWSSWFPYELMLLVVQNTGSTTDTGTPAPQNVTYTKIASFVLPITPQDLLIEMPFASIVQATVNGGIIEQHSGAPFRDILFAGTTGLTPVKNLAGSKIPLSNFADSQLGSTASAIFAGTVSNAVGTLRSGMNALGGTFFNTNINQDLSSNNTPDPDLIPKLSTGYAQFRLLQKFFEYYAETKRKVTTVNHPALTFNSKDLRLAFGIWKDEAVYLTTPIKFSIKRSQNSPMEYTYTVQLRPWKRINYSNVALVNSNQNVPLPAKSPNLYSSLLSRMNAVNDVMVGLKGTIQALIQDPKDDLGTINRQIGLFLKNATGLNQTVADFPTSIQLDLIPFIVSNWATVRTSLIHLPSDPPAQYVSSPNGLLGVTAITNTSANNIQTSNVSNLQALQYLQQITPNKLPISPQTIQALKNENARVAAFTRIDFINMKTRLLDIMNSFADTIGLNGDSTFNSIYNHQQLPEVHTAEPEEISALYQMNETVLILNHLAASRTIDPITPTSLEYVAGLAQKSGIAFQIPVSKFSIPFPLNSSLERIAAKYLNDPDRWHEIATLNGLRAPYVDEEGFSLPFQVNGSGNSLYVTDISNLYVGQPVYLSSSTIPRNSRRIQQIVTIYQGYYQIIVNGNPDLGNYLIPNSPVLEAFLPGTVNSQQLLYIPSQKASGSDLRTMDIPGINIFDPLLQVGGTDLLLTNDMDLAITQSGDAIISYGLQNIIQTIKIALSTPQGSLVQHPEFGLPLSIGQSLADMSASDLANAISNLFSGDPTFTGVSNVQIITKAPGTTINMSVTIAGINDNVPLSFSLNRP